MLVLIPNLPAITALICLISVPTLKPISPLFNPEPTTTPPPILTEPVASFGFAAKACDKSN